MASPHDPSPREPRGTVDTRGSVPLAALVTLPVHPAWPSQANTAPATDAADGPATHRAVFLSPPPDKTCAAPGPVEAVDTDRTSHPPPIPPWHDADPVELRGLPPATAPSHALDRVRTQPEQPLALQSTLAVDVDADDGPLVGCPFTGAPVTGSIRT